MSVPVRDHPFGFSSLPAFRRVRFSCPATPSAMTAARAREEVVMHCVPHERGRRQPLLERLALRRSPVPRRDLAERHFRHTAWIERKPGAMWDAIPAAPSAVVR